VPTNLELINNSEIHKKGRTFLLDDKDTKKPKKTRVLDYKKFQLPL